ncbi:MAG TPA: hypothetical protein VK892_04275 [Pyrinomonadaceae bacterium]|nr:hypothetical protein [Pyrinomonadaceae bacterium]
MFVKPRRVKLAVRRSDFKINGQSICLMLEFKNPTKPQLFALWAERDDIELVERYKLEFEVVESRRRGKETRHKNNYYLASIREADFQKPNVVNAFWQTVKSKLEDRNFTEDEKQKFISRIEEFVPKM